MATKTSTVPAHVLNSLFRLRDRLLPRLYRGFLLRIGIRCPSPEDGSIEWELEQVRNVGKLKQGEWREFDTLLQMASFLGELIRFAETCPRDPLGALARAAIPSFAPPASPVPEWEKEPDEVTFSVFAIGRGNDHLFALDYMLQKLVRMTEAAQLNPTVDAGALRSLYALQAQVQGYHRTNAAPLAA